MLRITPFYAGRPGYMWGPNGEDPTRCRDLAVWPGQAPIACATGGLCLGFLTLVLDILQLKNCTKLFRQTLPAFNARWCKKRRYTNVFCFSLKIARLKLTPGVWYLRVISLSEAYFCGVSEALSLWVDTLE